LKDANGNAIYTPVTADEMEFNTNFGRVRLNPNGPDADAEAGSDAYLGFSIVGENKTDFSVAMAAGVVIGMRGRTPILMAGAATLATVWILTSPVQQGLPIVDDYFYSQSKHNKEVIEGLIGTAVDHIEKIRNNPGSRDVNHWKGEIKAALDRAKNIAERLKGKTKEAIKEKIRELENRAESQ